jgi:hypothetical protein
MLHGMAGKIRLFLLLLVAPGIVSAQADTSSQRKHARNREALVYAGIGAFYTGLGFGLYQAWYKDYPFQKFHFFNDNSEWLQMDKAGHAFSCYAEGVNGMELMQWAGLPEKKAVWVGGLIGFGMQTIVEVMDGRSAHWGFSWGDMTANTLGSAMAISQEFAWKEQRIQIRISYHESGLRQVRPGLLGDGPVQGLLKDYNGQTYWLSVNPESFMPQSRWPAWLNLAVGYGGYGMLTGDAGNTWTGNDGAYHDYSSLPRYRQFYFSPDINLEKIGYIKKHRMLYKAARFISFIKIPMPAVEISRQGIHGHLIYF